MTIQLCTAGDLYNMPHIFVYCNAISEWKKCLSLVLFIFMTGTEVHKSMHGFLMCIFLDSDFHFFTFYWSIYFLPYLYFFITFWFLENIFSYRLPPYCAIHYAFLLTASSQGVSRLFSRINQHCYVNNIYCLVI